MIQDISPSVFENHFVDYKAEPDDFALYFSEGKLLCKYDENAKALVFPVVSDFPSSKSVYSFSIDKQKYFLIQEAAKIPEGFSYYDLRELRRLLLATNKEIFAAYSAFHLWKWYNANRFSGCCGKPTVRDTVERALICPECGAKIYPRINPAVIIGIINGDKILITKYRKGYAHNALVAGFTEFGETLEQTVEREVMEEVGLKVKNIRYYKSQPWGMAEDLLAGFYCEVDGDDKIKMDEGELKYAEWVNRTEIELQPSDYSLTNEMMKLFRDGKIF
ncbi:MAG: NAD(+) diphosphatase [Treponema sp.]|nr:NAD(+) diphosphatase [Treponema sp.]